VNDHDLAADLATRAGHLLVELRATSVAERMHPDDIRDAGDKQSHDWLIAALRTARPDDAVLSEEGDDDHHRRLNAERVWIIDPLDGTREYGDAERADWAVHVALWCNGELIAGAVSLPAIERTFSTGDTSWPPLTARTRPRVITSRTRMPYVAQVIAHAVGADVVHLGSAGAKAMAVVLGEADIYAHAGGMYEWDTAAPVAVAAAAGLHVSRIDGSPLEYNQRDSWLPDVLICRPELAGPALAAVRSLFG
jgi:3'(2'), 5'-bisphosphate nucleotidase